MSPLEIEILLHYHTTPGDYPRQDAPATKEAIAKFISHGILLDIPNDDAKYQVNRAASTVYVKAICDVHLPINIWVIPDLNKSLNKQRKNEQTRN